MRRFAITLFALVVLSQLGATDCDGQVLRDKGFDLWCGEELCAWKVERGSIDRIPTWNEGDPGVELVGGDVAIAQLTPVDWTDGTCIQFEMIANVETNAEVRINVDVLDDTRLEMSERLPTAKWKPLSYLIHIRGPYAGVRFEITKVGSGRAMLAKIGAKIMSPTDCNGLPELDARPQPLGTPCELDTDCGSGMCGVSPVPAPFGPFGIAKTCLECDAARPCSGTDVCGVTDPVSPVRAAPQVCVAPASKVLGEQCAVDAECTTGICTRTTCSTCDPDVGCANGETCGEAWDVPYSIHTAWVCSPNGHRRAAGEPCASDDDCASSTCNGVVRNQCTDGRDCVTADQCPFANLIHSACTTVGIQGGTCQ